MEKVYSSFVDCGVPVHILSTAINGVLKADGPLTTVRYDYHIDVKRDVYNSKNEELIVLYSEFFRYIKWLDLSLVDMGNGSSRLCYTYGRAKNTAGLVAAILFQLIIAFSVGAAFATIPFEIAPVLTFFIAFSITALIFSCIPLIVIKGYSDEKINKLFQQNFVARINDYINIVVRNTKVY